MLIDNIGWNEDWVKSKTLEEFTSNLQMQQLYGHLSQPDRINALENVHNLITGGEPQPAGQQITEEQA